MRFLVDENLPRRFANILRDAGHDVSHVLDLDLGGRPDDDLFELARREGFVVVTKDADFSALAVLGGEDASRFCGHSRAHSTLLTRRLEKRAGERGAAAGTSRLMTRVRSSSPPARRLGTPRRTCQAAHLVCPTVVAPGRGVQYAVRVASPPC